MRTLLLESSTPFTGDMLVGLLCDLGVKPSAFEWELSKVDLGDFHMHFERRQQGGAEGTHFSIHAGAVHTHDQDADEGTAYAAHVHEEGTPAHGHEHGDYEHHNHDHHDHSHEHHDEHGDECQSAAEFRQRLETGDLPDAVKRRMLNVFDHFCLMEAKKLDADPQTLAFEGEGALTVGAQIVCACAGLAELEIEHLGGGATADEPLAAAILEVYRTEDSSSPASSEARNRYGIGTSGSLCGVLG